MLQQINVMRRLILVLSLTCGIMTGWSQNLNSDLLRKAKALGVSDQDIAAAQSANPLGQGDVAPALSSDPNAEQVDRSEALPVGEAYQLPDSSQRDMVFGQEIFSNKDLTFAPNYNIATPPDYVLGPNDEVVIEVWGDSEFSRRVKLSPEGSVNLGGGIGPIDLAGLTISEAQQRVSSRVGQVMSGQVKVSLGQMRSIKVNLSGEVRVPGTYTLPSLATLFNALYSAGGVNNIGSLRHIQVFRNSKKIADLDVYDYLINGKFETNIRLEDNDMIIVPPYENHVRIAGPVKRPMIYDLKTDESLGKLLAYAGGFAGDAYSEHVTVYRKSGPMRTIQTVDRASSGSFVMHDGDSVRIDKVLPIYANMVSIQGGVWRPGEYEFGRSITTLSSLIKAAGGLRGTEFVSRGQITRVNADETLTLIPFNVRDAASGKTDMPLANRDEVNIPQIQDVHQDYTVSVSGEVNAPQTFAFRKGMTVEDAILLCGGLSESASLARVEVARRVKQPGATTYSDQIALAYTFAISEDLSIAPEDKRFVLEPYDEIYVRRSPGYSVQQKVTLSGEVLFDGEYVLAKAGERLSDVIQKAGGFTPLAYVKGSSLNRRLTPDERAKVDAIMNVVRDNQRAEDSLSRQAVDVSEYKTLGIDVEAAIKSPGGEEDILLQDGDRILIPKYNGTVQIAGAVLYQNSTVYTSNKLKDYIYQAGGYRQDARHRPFVIYMNGKVAATRQGFFMKHYPKIEPGCVVIVPLKKQRKGNGLATTMGMMTSSASLAAMVASILNLTK